MPGRSSVTNNMAENDSYFSKDLALERSVSPILNIGKLDKDGRLALFGRSNDMIISGGYNIYPKEIELILDEIEGIKESAVIGCPHNDLGEAIVAVLISNQNNIISDDKMNEILLESLANFKCPLRYLWLDELPRNAMGKVQKKVLKGKFENIFKE